MPPFVETHFAVKRTDAHTGHFEGLASVFGTIDRVGDIVEPGAFSATLGRLAKNATKLPLLHNHDSGIPIGFITEAVETPAGLEVKGQLLLEVEHARTAHSLMKSGAAFLSFGYRIEPGGSYMKDGTRYLTNVDLMEVSVVSTPAHPDARVTRVKHFTSPADLERALRADLGLPGRAAKKLVAGGWPALTGDDYDDDEAVPAMAKSLQAYTKNLRFKS